MQMPRASGDRATGTWRRPAGGQRRGRCGAWSYVLLNAAVLDADDTVGKLLEAWVVGDNDDGAAARARELAEQLHHRQRGLRIERGGRLVADEDRRVAAERAGDRDALLLPAAEVGRQVM